MTARSQAGVPGTISAGLAILSGSEASFFMQRGDGAGEVVMAAGQADLNACDVADEAVADDLRSLVKGGQRSLPGAGLPDDVVLLHGLDDGLLLGDGAGERLFAVDVLFAVGGRGGHDWRASDRGRRS